MNPPACSDAAPIEGEGHLLHALAGLLAGALAVTALVKIMVLAPKQELLLPPVAGCNLSTETCEARLPDGEKLSLAMTPRPTPLLSPLALEVRIDGKAARPVEIDFSGVDFPMAHTRAYLKPDGAGRHTAEMRLPVCAYGRMTWQAAVRIESGGRAVIVPFRFETQGNSSAQG